MLAGDDSLGVIGCVVKLRQLLSRAIDLSQLAEPLPLL
jgi:hypothetical protein